MGTSTRDDVVLREFGHAKVNIDYTGILPGDKVPDTDEAPRARPQPHAQAQSQPQPQSHAHAQPHANAPAHAQSHAPHKPAEPAGQPQPTARAGSANVVVLSADPTLIDLLRDALAGTHRVWRADDATHAADLMVASGNAVLLIDASLADHDTKTLVTQIHSQFPDLAIIVAGRRDDEHELAPLVSEGVIFRFLHKPASAERIRNFVDATQRRANGTDQSATMPPRHKKDLLAATAEHPVLAPIRRVKMDQAFTRRWGRRGLLVIPLALVVWGIIEWQPWNRATTATSPAAKAPVAAADAAGQAEIQKMLDAAGLALSQGALIDPPGHNALELYRAVLARDPASGPARRGIDSVADELLVQAERALMEQDLGRLASAVDAARSARPDHPRLEFFMTQLERERTRQGDSADSPRVVDTLGRPIAPAPGTELPSVRVQAFVQLASERMKSNQLIGKDSATSYLASARKLDAANPAVQEGVASLAILLQSNAQKAIRENRLEEANRWLQSAIEVDADRTLIATMRAQIDAARIDNVRADNAKLLILANQRIAQGRLVEPKGDSARHYLDLLRAADPKFEGLADTSAILATRSLAETQTQIAAKNADRAELFLQAAADAGAPAAEVADLSGKITALRIVRPAAATPKEPPAVVNESQMRRTFFMAPEYPDRARAREVEGWVDLEFTVATDGTTRDVTVRAAEPTGVFDRAALDAVKRWRYEPRVVDGSVVDQRVEARLRFRLQ
jgi:TonB family protein